ncbi:MAG: hypothetical protein GWP91_25465 [Rhodobacterales bacterium]|nr:hypothetical protein [Rhodobacterales bacterium]
MTPLPEQTEDLKATWSASGVSIQIKPLPTDGGRLRESLIHTFLGLYATFTVIVVAGALTWMGAGFARPPSSKLAALSMGVPVFLTILNYGRHLSARLWIDVSQNRLILRHRMFGTSFGTQQIDLAEITSAQHDGQTLLIQLRSGGSIREPIPALSPKVVSWVASLIEQARDQNADFWRETLGNTKQHAALQQIVKESTPTRRG